MAVGNEPAIAPERGFLHLLLIINRGHWPHLLENSMGKIKCLFVCAAIIVSAPVFANKTTKSQSELKQQNSQFSKQMQDQIVEDMNKKSITVWRPPVMIDCRDTRTGKEEKCEIQTLK